MKNKQINKIKAHYEIFINGKKFKVLSCKIDKNNNTIAITTKIFGQDFPQNSKVSILIPSENLSENFEVKLNYMYKNTATEQWHYTITQQNL